MTTLGIMKARIASELSRTDLTDQIANAINTAISEYAKQRFRFSDSVLNDMPTFNTVIGRANYFIGDALAIGFSMHIDRVWAQIGGMLQRLEQDDPRNIREYNQLGTMRGQPMWWGFESNQILLGPVPDAVYTMTLDVFRNVGAPADDDEADNKWMTDGELLIRSRAKYEIALHVTRNKQMQQDMSPLPPGNEAGHATWYAWKSLKGEGNRVVGLGRIRAMQF